MTATQPDLLGTLTPGTAAAPLPAVPAHHAHALVLTVHGQPITQGSLKSLGAGRPSVHSNAKRLKPWRAAVHDAAVDAMQLHDRYLGPVQVRLLFTFDRPAAHYRTGRNAHLLRDGAPCAPATRSSGDLDKLQRAIFDALTDGGVWRDDSQVVEVRARKTWTGSDDGPRSPGVRIEIRPATR